MTELSVICNRLYRGEAFKDFRKLDRNKKICVIENVAIKALSMAALTVFVGFSSYVSLVFTAVSLYCFSDVTQQEVSQKLEGVFTEHLSKIPQLITGFLTSHGKK